MESSRLEYKTGWNPAECVRTICAFANDIDDQDGGYIVIGVEEKDGRPIFPAKGIDPMSVDAIEKDLLNKCHFIEPFYHPRVEICAYGEATLIVLWVPAGGGRPYKASKDVFKNRGTKAYFIRRGSNTVEADGESLRELFDRSSRIPFDDRENPFASIEDLDRDLMREHLRDVGSALYEQSGGESALDLARDMRLVTGPRESPLPRNVGILMFSREVQRFFPYARIEVVDMPDPTGRGMTEKTFEGPIQLQLQDALTYIRGYIVEEKIDKLVDSIATRRTWNYPPAAIKELLANAVYHRDYRISEPITVLRTPGYLEIRSFPGLDRSITDAMVKGLDMRSAGEYRNRRIGNFLKELRLTEGRNTGIPTAVEALRANGSADPLFMMDPERRSLTVRIPVHEAFLGEGESRAYRVEPSRRRSRDELSRDVLALLSARGLSARGIAAQLGYSGVTSALRGVLADLVASGILTVEGRGRATTYRLAR